MTTIDRRFYAAMYGPTTGDRVRLGDMDLTARIEADDTSPGDEILGGCGKTFREGLLAGGRVGESQLDLLISNVILIDPIAGVRKTNIGVKDGRIVGYGRAGNPDVVDGVDLIVGSHTALIPGEGLIATAGAIDSHVHLASPAIVDVALSAGITTLVGMGLGGVWDVGVNPAHNLHRMIDSWRDVPINASFLARGSVTAPGLLERAVLSGASGFKVHEDFGAYPAALDTCLTVAEAADLPVALHTDSMNESGMLDDTLEATAGRTVHAYHVEGGGGHPNVLEILAHPHILGSSTTPTVPFTINTVAELLPMTMTVHRQNPASESDVEVTRSRVRASAIAGENALHALGAVSIVNSDSMGMGRIGEMIRRTWQLAAYTKAAGIGDDDDNERVLRFLAKLTINPALAHGIARHVGTIAPGRLADIVLWHPAWFGAKPELVLKSGFVAWGNSGSGAGSTRVSQPRRYRSFFGGMGSAPGALSAIFVAQEALDDAGARRSLPRGRHYLPVRGARGLTRRDMIRNSTVPQVEVPPDGGLVMIDGRPVTLKPAAHLPLTHLHHLA